MLSQYVRVLILNPTQNVTKPCDRHVFIVRMSNKTMSSHETKAPLSASSPQVSSSLSNRDELDIDMMTENDNKMVVSSLLPLPPPYPLASKRLVRSSSLVNSSCMMKWHKTGKRQEEEDDPFLIALRKCSSDIKIDDDDPFLIAIRKCSKNIKIGDDKVVFKRKNSLKSLVSCIAPRVKD